MYLKWVGGKTLLSKDLISQFPKNIDSYIEPFCGSAAMYFCFHPKIDAENSCFEQDEPLFKKSYLYDINSHLINCHVVVRDNIEKLISILKQIETEHNKYKNIDLAKKFYVSIRNEATRPITEENKTELAAHFIYINKTCFNGIWRVNKSGKNNVPFNNNINISFDYPTLHKASKMLQNCFLETKTFKNLEIKKENETFVYLDPPYYPLSQTSNFTSYNSAKVNDEELLDSLFVFCKDLDSKNIKWMMSNSSANEVKDKFSEWNIREIEVHRFVKALKKDQVREKVKEIVVTNY